MNELTALADGSLDPADDGPAVSRRRIVEWEDPAIGAGRALELSGMDYLQAMRRGEVPPPPISALLGMDIVGLEPGKVTFALEPGEHLYNPIGSVHGGVACTLLDSVMGCAVHTVLPQGRAYTTLELKVNLVRPITTKVDRVLAEGLLVTQGSRVATATGQIVDERGKLYAHASTTCLVFPVDGRTA